MAASKLMIDHSDELYAVWDGKPARGYGGTADVVAYARAHGTSVHVIWPPGAQRDLVRCWPPGPAGAAAVLAASRRAG